MADKRISGLTAMTTISKDDILLVVDDPAGTPTNKKISIEKFFSNVEPQTVFANITAASNSTVGSVVFKGGVGVMIETATSLIEAFLTPWTTIGTLLMEIIQPALDMVPDSIKNLFMGDTAQVAGDLQTAAVTSPAAAAATPGTAEATAGADRPQVINISLNLDGKEIDKKVVNLLGGVVKEAVL